MTLLNSTVQYTFDCAWDCPIQDFLNDLQQYNLTLESYIPYGPGGGNPEITVSGTLENINKFSHQINS